MMRRAMGSAAMRVVVVGGGIGGIAAANALLQRGLDVRVYEQASALTEVGAGVALQPNGLRALQRLGFDEEITRCGARWTDAQFRRADGTFIFRQAREVEFYGMHRADLLGMLVDPLPAEIIQTGHRCVGFAQDDEQAPSPSRTAHASPPMSSSEQTASTRRSSRTSSNPRHRYRRAAWRIAASSRPRASTGRPGRCATGWVAVSASWSSPCGPIS